MDYQSILIFLLGWLAGISISGITNLHAKFGYYYSHDFLFQWYTKKKTLVLYLMHERPFHIHMDWDPMVLQYSLPFNSTMDDMMLPFCKQIGHNLIVISDEDLSIYTDRSSSKKVVHLENEETTAHGMFTVTNRTMGMERALMWLVRNQDQYDYAWIVQGNVYWNDTTKFKAFMDSYEDSTIDLLHQNCGLEENPYNEYHERELRFLFPPRARRKAGFPPPFFQGNFEVYRISRELVHELNMWRRKNSGEWTYYEVLLPTLAAHTENIQSGCYREDALGDIFAIDPIPEPEIYPW